MVISFGRRGELITDIVVILEERDDDACVKQIFTIHLHLSSRIRL